MVTGVQWSCWSWLWLPCQTHPRGESSPTSFSSLAPQGRSAVPRHAEAPQPLPGFGQAAGAPRGGSPVLLLSVERSPGPDCPSLERSGTMVALGAGRSGWVLPAEPSRAHTGDGPAGQVPGPPWPCRGGGWQGAAWPPRGSDKVPERLRFVGRRQPRGRSAVLRPAQRGDRRRLPARSQRSPAAASPRAGRVSSRGSEGFRCRGAARSQQRARRAARPRLSRGGYRRRQRGPGRRQRRPGRRHGPGLSLPSPRAALRRLCPAK